MDEHIKGLPNDDDLMLGEFCLYAAGQLSILFNLVDGGKMTLEDVSKIMEMHITELAVNRCIWNIGGIRAQADAVKRIITEPLERERAKAEEEN